MYKSKRSRFCLVFVFFVLWLIGQGCGSANESNNEGQVNDDSACCTFWDPNAPAGGEVKGAWVPTCIGCPR